VLGLTKPVTIPSAEAPARTPHRRMESPRRRAGLSRGLDLELGLRLGAAEEALTSSTAMTNQKLITSGVAAVLALGGAAAIGHSIGVHPASADNGSGRAESSARPVADDSAAREIYDGAKDSVTYISSTLPEGQATGSGFVVSDDGLVVTNHHVIEGAGQVAVVVGTDGKQRAAQVVADDPSHDLALLQVDTGGAKLKPLALGDSSKVGVGDTTYAIGNPFGLDHTFTSGIVSALDRDIQAPDGATISGAIQTDAAINPGNSGGPLLDENGDVIGVNSQIATGGQGGEGGNVGIGFAVPSDTVKSFLDGARSGGDAPQDQTQQGQGAQPQAPVSPYGDQAPADPYSDPYGYDQQPGDPYGQDQGPDPYGGQPSDPYGIDPSDPYGYGGGSQSGDPYGILIP
jgi:putative serine protease PepD